MCTGGRLVHVKSRPSSFLIQHSLSHRHCIALALACITCWLASRGAARMMQTTSSSQRVVSTWRVAMAATVRRTQGSNCPPAGLATTDADLICLHSPPHPSPCTSGVGLCAAAEEGSGQPCCSPGEDATFPDTWLPARCTGRRFCWPGDWGGQWLKGYALTPCSSTSLEHALRFPGRSCRGQVDHVRQRVAQEAAGWHQPGG